MKLLIVLFTIYFTLQLGYGQKCSIKLSQLNGKVLNSIPNKDCGRCFSAQVYVTAMLNGAGYNSLSFYSQDNNSPEHSVEIQYKPFVEDNPIELSFSDSEVWGVSYSILTSCHTYTVNGKILQDYTFEIRWAKSFNADDGWYSQNLVLEGFEPYSSSNRLILNIYFLMLYVVITLFI